MEKCILCGKKIKHRKFDDEFFDKAHHLECNINIIIIEGITYVLIRNSKGYENYWHIDGPLPLMDYDESFAHKFAHKLEESIESVL